MSHLQISLHMLKLVVISGQFCYLNKGLGDLDAFSYVNQILVRSIIFPFSLLYKHVNRFASLTRDNSLSNFLGVDKLGRSASYILYSVDLKRLFRCFDIPQVT